jgi:hypothetical protein
LTFSKTTSGDVVFAAFLAGAWLILLLVNSVAVRWMTVGLDTTDTFRAGCPLRGAPDFTLKEVDCSVPEYEQLKIYFCF